MTHPIFDPSLVIVPPMDLNRGAPGIDVISPSPMKLRTSRGVGLFGTRRVANQLIRMHEGVDLLAPMGTPVVATGPGTVVGGSGTSRLIRHDRGLTYLTFSQHLQNLVVNIDDSVSAGQLIGEVGDSAVDHLHFEVRYPIDPTAEPSRGRSVPIDPTNALYQWEVRTFQNDAEVRHIINDVTITSLEEVWRGRLLRFLMINVSGSDRDLFLPLIDPTPATSSLAETIKLAFFHGKRSRIVWRESLFFSSIQSMSERASVIAEIKVVN